MTDATARQDGTRSDESTRLPPVRASLAGMPRFCNRYNRNGASVIPS